MAEFIMIGAATLGVFALFLGILALKEKRASTKPRIHTCANSGGCQCTGESKNEMPADDPATGQRPCAR